MTALAWVRRSLTALAWLVAGLSFVVYAVALQVGQSCARDLAGWCAFAFAGSILWLARHYDRGTTR